MNHNGAEDMKILRKKAATAASAATAEAADEQKHRQSH